MKLRFFIFFALSLIMVGCKTNDPDPATEDEAFRGNWYCTEEKGNFSLKMSVLTYDIDTVITIDTVYSAPYECYTLTKDGYLLQAADTLAGYSYNEREGIMMLSTSYMVARMEMPTFVASLIQIPDSVEASFNYTATTARGELHLSNSGIAMDVVPYSYTFEGRAYFQRSAE